MGLGKTYSADYLIDSNGNTGVSGQVLISTATGIDWADGSAITGGPYLPLAGGTITGVIQFNDHTIYGDQVYAKWGAANDLTIGHNATNSVISNAVGNLYISNHSDDKDIIFECDNGSGASASYLTLDGSTTHAYFSNPGNVGIGTTGPTAKLDVQQSTAGNIISAEFDNLDYTSGNRNAIKVRQQVSASGSYSAFLGSHKETGNLFLSNDSITADHLVITSTGKVGIGEDSPNATLAVTGDIDDNWVGRFENTDTGGYGILAKIAGTSANERIFEARVGSSTKMLISGDGNATFAGNVTIGNGTASEIPLTFNSSATDFALGANGSNFMIGTSSDLDAGNLITLSSAGNLGIGTTSPGAKLDIHAATNTNGLLIREDTDDSITHNFYIDSSDNAVGVLYADAQVAKIQLNTAGNSYFNGGNVGIGTTAPEARLEIEDNGTDKTQIVKITADDANPYGLVIGNDTFSTTDYEGLGFLVTNDGIGTVDTRGTNTEFRIRTGATPTEAMRIDSAGSVGIGDTSPTQISANTFSLSVNSSRTDLSGGLISKANGTVKHQQYWDTGGYNFALSASSGNFKFTGGNVGIGTTNPTFLLHVQGTPPANNGALINARNSAATTTNTTFGGIFFNSSPGYDFSIGKSNVNSVTTLSFRNGNNGASLMDITPSGNVGIGTTDPEKKLHIKGATNDATPQILVQNGGTGDASVSFNVSGQSYVVGIDYDDSKKFKIASSSNLGTNDRITLLSTGQVGIGTITPNAKLHVDGNQYIDGDLDIKSPGVGNSITVLQSTSGNAVVNIGESAVGHGFLSLYEVGVGDVIRFDANANSFINRGNVGIGTTSPSAGSKLEVIGKGDQLGSTGFYVNSSFKDDTNVGVFICHDDTTNTTGAIAGINQLSFITYGGTSNAWGERMKITGAGNVGIGTTTPSSKLQVSGDAYVTEEFGQGVAIADKIATYGAEFRTSGASAQVFFGRSGNNIGSGAIGADSSYVFRVWKPTDFSNPFVIEQGGNVGIGTTAPTHKLHVDGDMRLTGALRDSNNAKGSAGQVLSSTGSATDWIPLPATATVYTPKVYNLNNSTNINSQGQKLVPDFGTLEIEGNTTIEGVGTNDTDFQVTGENTGIYEVTYAVFYKNTGNQRTPLGTYLTLNGTAVNGSLMVNYLRSDVAGGGNWSSCTNTFYVNVTNASHPMALCVRRADSSTAPSGISMVEPAGMAVKSTISFRRIS